MGLFGFLKRRTPTRSAETDAYIHAMLRGEAARPLHYTLAHVAFRSMALTQPVRYLHAIGSENAGAFVAAVYRKICQDCDDALPDFAPEDIVPHPVRVGSYPFAVLQFPEPRYATEAFFTGLLVLRDVSDEFKDAEGAVIPARYLTLERGFAEDGSPCTVLCEWKDESHCNYGDGPPADLGSFCTAVEALLAAQQDG